MDYKPFIAPDEKANCSIFVAKNFMSYANAVGLIGNIVAIQAMGESQSPTAELPVDKVEPTAPPLNFYMQLPIPPGSPENFQAHSYNIAKEVEFMRAVGFGVNGFARLYNEHNQGTTIEDAFAAMTQLPDIQDYMQRQMRQLSTLYLGTV